MPITIAGTALASPVVYEWQSSRDLLVAAGGTMPGTAYVWNLEREMCQDKVLPLASAICGKVLWRRRAVDPAVSQCVDQGACVQTMQVFDRGGSDVPWQHLAMTREGPPLLFAGSIDGNVTLFDLRQHDGDAAARVQLHDGPMVRSLPRLALYQDHTGTIRRLMLCRVNEHSRLLLPPCRRAGKVMLCSLA